MNSYFKQWQIFWKNTRMPSITNVVKVLIYRVLINGHNQSFPSEPDMSHQMLTSRPPKVLINPSKDPWTNYVYKHHIPMKNILNSIYSQLEPGAQSMSSHCADFWVGLNSGLCWVVTGVGWVGSLVIWSHLAVRTEELATYLWILALYRKFPGKISLFGSIHCSFRPYKSPVPVAEKPLHSMTLPSPCFTAGVLLDG